MTLYDLIEDVCVLKSPAKVENGVTIESRSHKQKGQVLVLFVAEMSKNHFGIFVQFVCFQNKDIQIHVGS